MINISFPFTEEKIRALNVGEGVPISSVVFTGPDVVKLASNFQWR